MKKIILFCMVAFGILSAGCSGDAEREVQKETRIAVRVSPVVAGKASFPVYASGMLSVKDTVKLSFKTGGIIREMLTEEGRYVQKGALLASLDLGEINARVKQAKSAFDYKKQEYERVRKLFDESVATLQQLQGAETELSMAKSELSVAEFNQKYSTIYAPESGRILKRMANSSELIGPGMPVFLFAASDKNWVLRFGVSDRDLVSLSIGDTAEVTFDVHPDEVFSGWISEIAEMADPYTGTFEVELAVNNPLQKKLVAGFIGKAVILPARKELLSLVPIDSLVEGSGNTAYVYRVAGNGNAVSMQRIIVRKILDEYVAVSSGISAGDKIVTIGAPYVRDNAEINIVGEDKPDVSLESGIIFDNREQVPK